MMLDGSDYQNLYDLNYYSPSISSGDEGVITVFSHVNGEGICSVLAEALVLLLIPNANSC